MGAPLDLLIDTAGEQRDANLVGAHLSVDADDDLLVASMLISMGLPVLPPDTPLLDACGAVAGVVRCYQQLSETLGALEGNAQEAIASVASTLAEVRSWCMTTSLG